jgi:hypothetical protein
MGRIVGGAGLSVLFGPIVALGAGTGVGAQASFDVLEPTVEIPHDDYASWSLFLICNPAWLEANGDAGIQRLYEQYRLFGEVIGPDNLAVWFWREPGLEPTVALTDVSRSAEYCARYRLLPSESPHVLVTTQHPDAEPVVDYFHVRFGALDAEDTAEVLAALTDQLLVTGLDQTGLEAATGWPRVLSAAGAAIGSIGAYFNRVSFTFNTGLFKAEIGHSGP